jgi:PAS domain S-box-containing protein
MIFLAMDEEIKILMLEDSPSDAKLIQWQLKKDGVRFNVKIVETCESYSAALTEFAPDVILCDHSLPGFNSMDALKIAREKAKEVPFILVTGSVSEEYAVSSIKAGAHDYILKSNLARLPLAIVSAIRQKESEARLRESEEKFQNTIDRMFDGIQIISYDWKYLYVNDIVARQGKYKKEDLLGHTMMEMYPGIEQSLMFKTLERGMKERILLEMENEVTLPDGTKSWFLLSIQPAAEGILILSKDITEKKNAIVKLEEQNHELLKINSELDRFVYSASHEMRAPLCNVLGLNTLAKTQKDEKLRQDLFNKIETSIGRLDAIIHDIVHFSRNSRLDLLQEKIDFNEIFSKSHAQCRELNGVEKVAATIDIKGNADFYSDSKRLEVLMKNLLSNAIKFSDRQKNNPYVKITVQAGEEEARLTISDNGIGIHEKFLNDIFKMFYRASESENGTGLGLYIVKEVVEKLGGTIRVESYPGSGTTFLIRLPNMKAAQS